MPTGTRCARWPRARAPRERGRGRTAGCSSSTRARGDDGVLPQLGAAGAAGQRVERGEAHRPLGQHRPLHRAPPALPAGAGRPAGGPARASVPALQSRGGRRDAEDRHRPASRVVRVRACRQPVTVQVRRVRAHPEPLPLPRYETALAAGMDLRADIDGELTLRPLERMAVPTGLALALPPGYEAQVRPRSGWRCGMASPCSTRPVRWTRTTGARCRSSSSTSPASPSPCGAASASPSSWWPR